MGSGPQAATGRRGGGRRRPPGGGGAPKPAGGRRFFPQREPVTLWAPVSNRIPATSRKTWPPLAKIVTHLPGPGSPNDMSWPDVSEADSSPADASTKETDPEQS